MEPPSTTAGRAESHAPARGVSVDGEGRPRADLNHDCKVDLLDYAIFQRDFLGP